MQHVLTALKDIPGVVGSFVLNDKGTLVSREMPAIYPDEIYPEMGRRLVGVYEAIALQVASLGDLVLKFEGYWFLCRRTAQCFLGILTTESVNFPALKMATNVALRQLDEKVGSMPALVAATTAKVVAEEPVIAAQKSRRIFRVDRSTRQRCSERGGPRGNICLGQLRSNTARRLCAEGRLSTEE